MSQKNTQILRALVIASIALLSTGYVLREDSKSEGKQTVFTGNEQHQITTETAMRYVGNYHSLSGEQLTAAYMGRNIFEKILAQENAVGIRIYNARLDDGQPTYVIVGVDRDGNDLLAGVIGEDVVPCPPSCGTNTLKLDRIALR